MRTFVLGLICIFFGDSSAAFTIDAREYELRRYYRCYALFTGERVAPADELLKSVESRSKSGTEACMALLDRAMLDEKGSLPAVNGVTDPLGRKVFSRLLELYQKELSNPSYISTFQSPRFEADLFDLNESGYQMIYTLFGQNQAYRDLVTRDFALSAKRERKENTKAIGSVVTNAEPAFSSAPLSTTNPNTNPTLIVSLTATFKDDVVQQGLLQGLVRDERPLLMPNRNNANMNFHFGAGMLGSIPYLFANTNLFTPPDGGFKTHRALAASMIEDTLCRPLPWVRPSDAIGFVNPASKLSFRAGVSCAHCHTSSDRAAAGLREVRYDKSHAFGVSFWNRNPVSEAAAPFPEIEGDLKFASRPSSGLLYYRTMNGALISQSFDGVKGLGQLIANLDDFYICAAKRHYRFLTGIDVDISDLGDPSNPVVLSKAEMLKRDLVRKLGLELKSHQSLRNLIKAIIERPEFALPGRGIL